MLVQKPQHVRQIGRGAVQRLAVRAITIVQGTEKRIQVRDITDNLLDLCFSIGVGDDGPGHIPEIFAPIIHKARQGLHVPYFGRFIQAIAVFFVDPLGRHQVGQPIFAHEIDLHGTVHAFID